MAVLPTFQVVLCLFAARAQQQKPKIADWGHRHPDNGNKVLRRVLLPNYNPSSLSSGAPILSQCCVPYALDEVSMRGWPCRPARCLGVYFSAAYMHVCARGLAHVENMQTWKESGFGRQRQNMFSSRSNSGLTDCRSRSLYFLNNFHGYNLCERPPLSKKGLCWNLDFLPLERDVISFFILGFIFTEEQCNG